ncbi:4'-phosphopantetheinyl transferase family protein [Verminephrobacter aporrectodeae]|uniref:4'-phosphopantetheinyl transferase family protein n=1 Tax=Verminephrobacter aporrectodeae TaxID=1110389 RepID=UPI0022430AA4|nr:4'-phosphopantetheinyl transferase superfamily protein [Verminephrobacter aporrectodeae]
MASSWQQYRLLILVWMSKHLDLSRSIPIFPRMCICDAELEIFNKLPATSSDGASLKQLYVARQWVRKEAIVKLGGCSLDRLSKLDLGELDFPDFSLDTFQRINSGCDYAMIDISIVNRVCLGALVWRGETQGILLSATKEGRNP